MSPRGREVEIAESRPFYTLQRWVSAHAVGLCMGHHSCTMRGCGRAQLHRKPMALIHRPHLPRTRAPHRTARSSLLVGGGDTGGGGGGDVSGGDGGGGDGGSGEGGGGGGEAWWPSQSHTMPPPMCLCEQGHTSSQYVRRWRAGQMRPSGVTLLVESKIPAHLGSRAGDPPALHQQHDDA